MSVQALLRLFRPSYRRTADLAAELGFELGLLHPLLHSMVRKALIRIQNGLLNLLSASQQHALEAA